MKHRRLVVTLVLLAAAMVTFVTASPTTASPTAADEFTMAEGINISLGCVLACVGFALMMVVFIVFCDSWYSRKD